VGQLLIDEELTFDIILCSDARRAEETLSLLFEESGFHGVVEMCADLYLAEPSKILARMREIDDRYPRALMIGHNPGFEEVVSRVTGQLTEMPTAALAELRFAVDAWSGVDPNRGGLARIWRARELEG
jgi:phosphohistidine phosphatase